MAKRDDELIAIARHRGVVTARDARAHAIAPSYLQRLTTRGILTRVARGVYALSEDGDYDEHQTLIEACARVPSGVICLLSALRFHNLTTQSPHEVWMALDGKAHRPEIRYPPLRIVRFGGAARTAGIEQHTLRGAEVRVYGVAKTVADCFKYRNKIGLDVALEALKECRRDRRTTVDALWEAAKVDRVENVMRPYLEAVQA